MKIITARKLGIDQGETLLFSDFEDDGEMWTGEGPRERRLAIAFSQSFHAPPAVHLALSMWDMDNGGNARADLSTDSITETGFEAVFRTWGDTRVARARVRWMAVGGLLDEDDWQLY